MDKSAVGHDYQADLSKHVSQTDAAKGFGGELCVLVSREKLTPELRWLKLVCMQLSVLEYSMILSQCL